MKTVVTGAAGFVGSTLAEQLLKDGHDVLGIDCMTDYYAEALKRTNLARLSAFPNFQFSNRSLLEPVEDLLDGTDTIFHQAGQPGVRPSWGASFDYYTRDNIAATQRILESMKHVAPAAKLVYASSSSVYGNAERYPTREVDRPQPLSPYGVTKLAAEHLVSLYAQNFGLHTVSLRYFTVYGPRQRPDMAFTRFITRAIAGRQIQLFGDGTQIRDFTYVSDVVAANIAAAESVKVAPGSIYNVSGGASVSVNEVLDVIEQEVETPISTERLAKATGDVYQTGGDSSSAFHDFGWEPKVGIRDGLARQVEWLRANHNAYLPFV